VYRKAFWDRALLNVVFFSAQPLSPNFWFPHDMHVVVNNLSDQERKQKSGGNSKIQQSQKDLQHAKSIYNISEKIVVGLE
jgi:hypothetical protein